MTQEEKEDLKELQRYQKIFAKYINSPNWDYIVEKLTDTSLSIITIINNATTPKDVNWLVFSNADYVVDRIRKLNKQIKR